MAQPIGAPGIGLPLAQYLYPSEVGGAAYDLSQNLISLAPGTSIPVPPGDWEIDLGQYSVLQLLDPVTGVWRGFNAARRQIRVRGDGQNMRVANLTGCPVAAVVTNAGSGYVQATTTCVSSTGGSTWQPIVGGMVSLSTVNTAGSGYTLQPFVFLNAPPSPGVQATAVATISGGSVTGITMVNAGAGYTAAPTAIILPNPSDPNLANIKQAKATMALYGSGSIAAVLCTNNGAPAAPTLTIAGAGSGGAATAVRLLTCTGATVAGGGGYGNAQTASLTTVGGMTSATPVNPNPSVDLSSLWVPRPAQLTVVSNAGGSLSSVSAVVDGGLFTGTPTFMLFGTTTLPGTIGNVTLTMGNAVDTILLQPAV